MKAFRKATALSSALCILAGVTLSPFVSLHVLESHGAVPGHHAADDVSIENSGHSHGNHDHATLEVATNGVLYRLVNHLGVASLAPILIRPLMALTANGFAHAVTSKPPRSRHPLSLTTALRI